MCLPRLHLVLTLLPAGAILVLIAVAWAEESPSAAELITLPAYPSTFVHAMNRGARLAAKAPDTAWVVAQDVDHDGLADEFDVYRGNDGHYYNRGLTADSVLRAFLDGFVRR